MYPNPKSSCKVNGVASAGSCCVGELVMVILGQATWMQLRVENLFSFNQAQHE
jgi:hypothetical protein